jgi:hypothetical protein
MLHRKHNLKRCDERDFAELVDRNWLDKEVKETSCQKKKKKKKKKKK